ncbi:hypothetical protein HYT45_01160 [Candidatus Uhrbacteria bacterium]|nr:hypothetical protein [Candidatus Uhrbacteria bacterium]
MIEQIGIFSANATETAWGGFQDIVNDFLAKKNNDGEYKQISRVFQNVDDDGYVILTIFYQWVKGPPNLGPFRTAPGGE